jgi:hypothetical protein
MSPVIVSHRSLMQTSKLVHKGMGFPQCQTVNTYYYVAITRISLKPKCQST